MTQVLALVVAILVVLFWHPGWVLTVAAIGGLTYLLAWLFSLIQGAAKG